VRVSHAAATGLAASSRGKLLVHGTRGKSRSYSKVTYLDPWQKRDGLDERLQGRTTDHHTNPQAMGQDCSWSWNRVWLGWPCCTAGEQWAVGGLEVCYQMKILGYQISGRLIPSKAELGAERINLPVPPTQGPYERSTGAGDDTAGIQNLEPHSSRLKYSRLFALRR
jgi:hypothetical protein